VMGRSTYVPLTLLPRRDRRLGPGDQAWGAIPIDRVVMGGLSDLKYQCGEYHPCRSW